MYGKQEKLNKAEIVKFGGECKIEDIEWKVKIYSYKL